MNNEPCLSAQLGIISAIIGFNDTNPDNHNECMEKCQKVATPATHLCKSQTTLFRVFIFQWENIFKAEKKSDHHGF